MADIDARDKGSRDPSPEAAISESAASESATTEDQVASLIRLAGPKPSVSPQVLSQLRAKTQDHWHRKVARVRRRRQATRRRWLAVAAAIVVAAGTTLLWSGRGPSDTVAVATIARFESVFGGNWEAPEQGLVPGAILTTKPGVRLALRLDDGVSLRLDGASRAVLDGPRTVTLEQGGVYLDTGPVDGTAPGGSEGASLEVHTPFGLARDIGTQFEVRVDEASLQVRVREGQVRVKTAAASHQATAGDHLRVAADGTVERRREATHGGPWSWVQQTAPTMDLEGKSLAAALRWMARETGWRVDYESAELAQEVEGILIHGAVQDLRPAEVPEVLLPSSGLYSALHRGSLKVCASREPCGAP